MTDFGRAYSERLYTGSVKCCSMNNTSSIDRAVTLGTQRADVPSVLF